MFSKSKLAIKHIGQESLYVIEKSGAAIYKEAGTDTQLAKDLLKSYREGFKNLQAAISSSEKYNRDFFFWEFNTLFYAIDRLNLALGNIKSEEEKLEAMIFHIHVSRQDDKIRRMIEESEQN